MIDLITDSLPEIKTGTQPKIYAEMMTIRLSQLEGPKEPALPANLEQDLQSLKEEVHQLKQAIKALNEGEKPAVALVTKTKQVSSQRYQVDRDKVITIMQETVVNSQQSREYLDALKGSWNEILERLTPQDRALLLGSEPVLANSENAILAFDAAFNAQQAMKRQDLNTIFGNIMSQTSGFSPNIMAIPREDFNAIRSEFAKSLKSETPSEEAPAEELIPEEFDFLAEKITIEEN